MSVTLQKTDDQNVNAVAAGVLSDSSEQKTTTRHMIAERISGEQVKQLHKEMIGDYFFEPETVAFFKSSVEFGYHIKAQKTIFFITCEKSPTGNVGYTVRKFSGNEKSKGVETLTEFNTLNREAAMCKMQELVKKSSS